MNQGALCFYSVSLGSFRAFTRCFCDNLRLYSSWHWVRVLSKKNFQLTSAGVASGKN